MRRVLSLWRGEMLITIPEESMADMLRRVSDQHGVPVDRIKGHFRGRQDTAARFDFMWRARQAGFSTTQIGRFLGGRDHSTVIHGSRTHEARMQEAA